MTIYQRMAAVFKAANVPGFLQQWRKTEAYPELPAEYGVYLVSDLRESLYADNAPLLTTYSISVHLYGMTDLTQARDSVLAALQDAGFEDVRQRDVNDVNAGEARYHKQINVVFNDWRD